MNFSLVIEPRALLEIQQAINYYDKQQEGLGERFLNAIEFHFNVLTDKPKFQIRYSNIRCLRVKKYPYLIHFSIEDKTVYIHAVLHTSLNPGKHWLQDKK